MRDCRREGDERLSGTDKAEAHRRNLESRMPADNTNQRPKRPSAPADLGRALRSVYDETLREDVPDDFRDLLGKLA